MKGSSLLWDVYSLRLLPYRGVLRTSARPASLIQVSVRNTQVRISMREHNPPDPSFSVCLSFLYSLVYPVRSTPKLFRSWQFSSHPTAFWPLHLPVRVTPLSPLVRDLCWLLVCTRLRSRGDKFLSSCPFLSTELGCVSRGTPSPQVPLSLVLQEPKNSVLAGLFCPRVSRWNSSRCSHCTSILSLRL